MHNQTKTRFLFYTLTLLVCLNCFFLGNTAAQVHITPVAAPDDSAYTYESIDVEGVQFLAVTASSDFGDYAGYTQLADGEKEVAFTIIDGVFTTYDFPGAQKTLFYAFDNNGQAAGYYVDSDGKHHGVILENGELQEYNFPNAVETEIHGISDATGDMTGNFIGTDGKQRGFSGNEIIDAPGASATYANFVNASGSVVGSYVDTEGVYYAYLRTPDGKFIELASSSPRQIDYIFIPGINDAGVIVARIKWPGELPQTLSGTLQGGWFPLNVPNSVSTEGWNINQDGSIVGHYVAADGRTHGFIAKPVEQITDDTRLLAIFSNYTFETIDVPGVDFLALTASSDFEDYAGYTRSPDDQKDIAWTLIDGVWTTYDFPGSQNTRFYALANNGNAAGYYEDSNGLHHGVVLENGELREYNFPNAIQTEIYGISDATGALTGNFIDASGVRRGFSGEDTIVEVPEATATYTDFVNSNGGMVGSYIDANGVYHPYVRTPNGQFETFFPLTDPERFEYFFVHSVNDAGFLIGRAKQINDVPRTYVGSLQLGLISFNFPDSVSTEGWNINQDGSIVGHYVSAMDGRTHGFIAKPAAQVSDESVVIPTISDYTFESIDVPGVDFLAVTASNDFEDYAGNTRRTNDNKEVAFTLIDGVFTTYDFPGSQKTHFYALGNNGNAAGYYEDSNGLHHGIILEDGELRQFAFKDAVETEIHGISDATGALTGNFIDASGVRRGFSGDTTIEYPGASATYTNFVNAIGVVVGSYIDADGIYHAYVRTPDGNFLVFDLPIPVPLEYFYVHHINTAGVGISRARAVGDVPRTFIGTFEGGLHEFQFPGSVSTEGWNVNQDGSVVGHYDSADGRTHGFIARPANKVRSDYFANVYNVTLSKGLNMISLPLAPPTPMNAKSLAGLTGTTTVITLDTANQRFVGWTPSAPDDGFPIEGGKAYIVNVPQPREFAFVGAPWTTQTEDAAAAPAISAETPQAQEAWAFVVSGHLGGQPAFDSYQVIVHNVRTNSTITAPVQGDYFAAATADLSRRSVVQVGDLLQVRVIGPDGNVESDTRSYKVTPEDLADVVLSVRLDSIGKPKLTQLLQNFPNPFNPETWIPYQLEKSADVTLQIYDTAGGIVRTLDLGFKGQGFYMTRTTAAYWDGRNNMGEQVASGVYFYSLQTPDFSATRKMLILK